MTEPYRSLVTKHKSSVLNLLSLPITRQEKNAAGWRGLLWPETIVVFTIYETPCGKCSCVIMPSNTLITRITSVLSLTLFVLSLCVAGGTRLQNRPPGVRVHRGGVGIHLSGHPEAGWKLRTKHTAL